MAQRRLQRLLSESRSGELTEREIPASNDGRIDKGFTELAKTLKAQTDMWRQMYKGKPSSGGGAALCLMNIVSVMEPMIRKGIGGEGMAVKTRQLHDALSKQGWDMVSNANKAAMSPTKPSPKKKR